MKVASTRGTGSASAAVAAIAVSLAVLAGAGLVPPHSASAVVPETGGALRALAPAEEPDKADEIREPSGLLVGAQSARRPTRIRSATARTASKVVGAPAQAAPADGWLRAKASWYGPGFVGNTMAGGGTLEWGSMVVAHRSLPFGTRIEFRYNGNTCIAVVQDRGPFTGGRTFDLGPGTAATLGFSGVGNVEYQIVP
ncbi:MAG: septal ring lytic transglycosylase RlpA family protein [Coriobacteriia bacterium]